MSSSVVSIHKYTRCMGKSYCCFSRAANRQDILYVQDVQDSCIPAIHFILKILIKTIFTHTAANLPEFSGPLS